MSASLPFQAEPLAVLCDRFPAALQPIIPLRDDARWYNPCLHRLHVFDFDCCPTRLVVFRVREAAATEPVTYVRFSSKNPSIGALVEKEDSPETAVNSSAMAELVSDLLLEHLSRLHNQNVVVRVVRLSLLCDSTVYGVDLVVEWIQSDLADALLEVSHQTLSQIEQTKKTESVFPPSSRRF